MEDWEILEFDIKDSLKQQHQADIHFKVIKEIEMDPPGEKTKKTIQPSQYKK